MFLATMIFVSDIWKLYTCIRLLSYMLTLCPLCSILQGLEVRHRMEWQPIHYSIHFNTWHLTQWLPWEKTLQEVGLTMTSIQMIHHLIREPYTNQSQLHLLSQILSAGFNSVDWGCSTSMVHTRLVILLLTFSKHALSLSQTLTKMEQFYLLATGMVRTLHNHGCKTYLLR